jgi:hypothetical protein
MRGSTQRQVLMLSTLTPERLVPADHPIRRIKVIVERALGELSPTFDVMYARNGRASIPPAQGMSADRAVLGAQRAPVLRAAPIRPALQVVPGHGHRGPCVDATTFTKNRDRLLAHEVAARFFAAVLAQAKAAQLISAEHFTVDGTLLES